MKGRISAGDRFLNGAAVTELSRLGLISVEGGTSAKKCYRTARKGFQQAHQCIRYLWWGPVVTVDGISPCQVD